MPLTDKGQKILKSFKEQYGEEKGTSYFYASKNKGTISGVDTRDISSEPEVYTPRPQPELTGVIPTEEAGYKTGDEEPEPDVATTEAYPTGNTIVGSENEPKAALEAADAAFGVLVGDQSLKGWNDRNRRFYDQGGTMPNQGTTASPSMGGSAMPAAGTSAATSSTPMRDEGTKEPSLSDMNEQN